MRFKRKDGKFRHFVDEDTGIEFFQENAPEGLDYATLVFRDSSHNGAPVEIIFRAPWLKRFSEQKDAEGKLRRVENWYGFEIPQSEFQSKFHAYAKGDTTKLRELRDYLTHALTYFFQEFGKVPEPVIRFSDN